MSTSRAPLVANTPANPSTLQRTIGGLTFTLDAEGLAIVGLEGSPPGSPIHFNPDAALALSDFLRSPGARGLVNRAWLAEQFSAMVFPPAQAEGDERRHKRHAGLAA